MNLNLSSDEANRLQKGCHWRELDVDADNHKRCEDCGSRVTVSADGTEYGHKYGCPHRPDYLPQNAEGGSRYTPKPVATDGGAAAEESPSVELQDGGDRLEELANRIQELENRDEHQEAKLDTFKGGLKSTRATIEELQEELEQERNERRRLENEVADLKARTNLLQVVENSDNMTAKQRSVVLIQHLRRAAQKERDRGRKARASVNRDEAERALQFPDLHRTTIYDDMKRAVRLVGNKDLLWFGRGSKGDKRLKLNLGAGDLPADVSLDHGRNEVR